ncbi:MAG: AraC family transcriptional regulator [Balneolaceae bacterium]
MALQFLPLHAHSLPVTELAAAVGYKSATTFREVFEERFGEHPLG